MRRSLPSGRATRAGGGSRRAPSPPGTPILGHAAAFRGDPLGFLVTAAKRCGPVARLRLGPLTYHLVSEPDLIGEVLQARSSNYLRDTRSSRRVRMVTGESLLTTEGTAWRQQRQAVQPIFHHRHLVGLGRTMLTVAEEATAGWERAAQSGAVLDLAAEMNRLSFAVAGRCLFGADLRNGAGEVEAAMPVLLEELFRRTSRVANLPLWLPLRRHRAFRRSLAAVDRVVGEVVAQPRRRGRGAGLECIDVVGLLLEARAEGRVTLSDADLRNHAVTFLLAGHETTANALTWALACLATAPSERALVEAELDRVAFDPRDPGALELLPRLERVGAVLQETLRLYPSIWIVERRVVETDDLGGCRIAAGSAVVVAPYVVQRQGERWPEPEAFRPARFLREDPPLSLSDGYLPFGAGPHSCIGQHFALMEARIVLATLLSRFRVRLVDGVPPPPLAGITLRPAAAVPVRVERRRP